MRLLNTASLRVESFPDNAIPPYAILSHVWGPAKDEVTFQDMQDGVAEQKSGYVKLQRSSAIARQNNLDYIWIDTCCIDKSSSAELSESINSMFRYYAKAETCYAFLADVSTLPGMPDFGTLLQASKWFTRGWTVQELVAPRELVFLNSSWAVLGTKDVFAERIADITNIDVMILSNPSQLQKASVAKRMSWASKRVTTREEDMAYCLLGVFDVNMPLLYGEGRKAFVRLQEEILKSSTDQSLFSWTPDATRYANQEHSGATGVLAQHPSEFAQTSHIVPFGANTNPYAMTNKGLQITLPILRISKQTCIAILACHQEGNFTGPVGIEIGSVTGEEGVYYRRFTPPATMSNSKWQKAKRRSIYILRERPKTLKGVSHIWLRTIPSKRSRFEITDYLVGSWGSWHRWDIANRTLRLSRLPVAQQNGAIAFAYPHYEDLFVHFGVRQDMNSLDSMSTRPYVFISFAQRFKYREDPQQHEYCSRAFASFTPTSQMIATTRIEVVMDQQVVIVDITAQDTSFKGRLETLAITTNGLLIHLGNLISQFAQWLLRTSALLGKIIWDRKVASSLLFLCLYPLIYLVGPLQGASLFATSTLSKEDEYLGQGQWMNEDDKKHYARVHSRLALLSNLAGLIILILVYSVWAALWYRWDERSLFGPVVLRSLLGFGLTITGLASVGEIQAGSTRGFAYPVVLLAMYLDWYYSNS